VSDLSPLKGMPLAGLSVGGVGVSELSPLKGMKLAWLHCNGTKVTDLSPLTGMPLEEIHFDTFKAERDGTILRAIPTLKTINGKPAAEFWRSVEKK
jgi:hypothetical protein